MGLLNLRRDQFAIMVLDDEPDVARAIEVELRGLAPIDLFHDPQDAIKALENKDYAVIISDLKMPKMTGIEFLEHCFKQKPHVPRVLVTAYIDLLQPEGSINRARLTQVIAKPWNKNELRDCITTAMQNFFIFKENELLRHIALTDALTGVANHRYFWERLDSEFSRAKRFDRPLALALADVDDFKKFNDEKGHLEGDRVLHEVAQCLEIGRRSMDMVARYGGEEFAIILPEVSREMAIDISKRHLESCIQSTQVSLTFGVASFPEDAQSPTELVYKADLAMLKAKKEGKRRVYSTQD